MPELLPCAPGSPEWLAARPAVKLTPWSRIGMIHGAYQAAGWGRIRGRTHGYHTPYAHSWQYRRGFARAFLTGREAARHDH